jgi:hypothetical protein
VLILLELSFIMDKTKRGIALFITLMVIAAIMSIIAVSFTYLEKVQKDAGTTSAILQGNLLHKNTVNILKSQGFDKKQGDIEKLKILYTMPLLLSEPKSGFGLSLSCKPLLIGVPISWLDKSLFPKTPQKVVLAVDILTLVMERYDVQEPNELERLIMKAVTGKVSQNEDDAPRIRSKRGIFSKSQFYRVIADYRLSFDDPKVLLVPWERYFSFTKVDKKTKIDGAYLTPEFISVAFEVPIEIVRDSWVFGDSTLESFLSQNSINNPYKGKKIFSQKALNAMHCEERYAYRDGQYKINFDYIKGRSGNFEFNGKAE